MLTFLKLLTVELGVLVIMFRWSEETRYLHHRAEKNYSITLIFGDRSCVINFSHPLVVVSAPRIFLVPDPFQHVLLNGAFSIPQKTSNTFMFALYPSIWNTCSLDQILSQS